MYILPATLYIIIAIVMMVFDTIWLTINKPMYSRMVFDVQKAPMSVRIWPAIGAYIIMYIGMVLIVIPMIKMTGDYSIWNIFRIAGLFGFCVYGIWNMTNMAIFKDFPLQTAILDTTWGTFIYFVVAWIAIKLMKRL